MFKRWIIYGDMTGRAWKPSDIMARINAPEWKRIEVDLRSTNTILKPICCSAKRSKGHRKFTEVYCLPCREMKCILRNFKRPQRRPSSLPRDRFDKCALELMQKIPFCPHSLAELPQSIFRVLRCTSEMKNIKIGVSIRAAVYELIFLIASTRRLFLPWKV